MVTAKSIDTQLKEERGRVDVDSSNFSIRELVRMMTDGELDIAPAYQRKFRWSAEVESSLIESLFLGLPVPGLFVATNEGFQWEVVDGLQRLSSLVHFMEPDLDTLARINRAEPLVLKGLTKVTQLNDKTYADLPKPLQLYFGRQPLQVTALTDKSDMHVRFDLFERLNRGSVVLSPQEVRACIYRGTFNDFLDRLAEDPTYKELLKLQQAKQSDGTSAEVVLKFFAYMNNRNKFSGRVTEFLNEYMDDNRERFDFDKGERVFLEATKELHRIIGGGPFLRSDYNVTPLVQFEACLVAIGELISTKQPIGSPDKDWINDSELKDASMGGTNTKAMLKRRIERGKVLLGGD